MENVRKEKINQGAFQDSGTWMHYLEAYVMKKGAFYLLVIYVHFKLTFFQNFEQYIGSLHPNLSNMLQHNYFWPAIIDFHIGEAFVFFHANVFFQSEYI